MVNMILYNAQKVKKSSGTLIAAIAVTDIGFPFVSALLKVQKQVKINHVQPYMKP